MKPLIPLALVLGCALLLAGCGKETPPAETAAPTVTPVATVTPVPTPTPIPTPDAPVTPPMVVEYPRAEEIPENKDFTLTVNGEEETVTMSYVPGSFASLGGPDFGLYMDPWRYQVNAMSGYCYLTLRTGMSGDVYAELGFREGETAEKLSTRILPEYGVTAPPEAPETVTLGVNEALLVHGETIGNVYDVYLIDTDTGCVTLVICTTAATQAHNVRLTASLETLTLS